MEVGGIDVVLYWVLVIDEVFVVNVEVRFIDVCLFVCSCDGGENVRLRYLRILCYMYVEYLGVVGEVSFSSDSNCGSNRNRSSK